MGCIECGLIIHSKNLCRKHYDYTRRMNDLEGFKARRIQRYKPEIESKQALSWYYENRTRMLPIKREYYRNNIEKFFINNKKQMLKISKELDMDIGKARYALNSWSKMVRKRDIYTCQTCGSNKNLNAHHIIYKKYYPQLMLNINNGITQCRKCHRELHGGHWIE